MISRRGILGAFLAAPATADSIMRPDNRSDVTDSIMRPENQRGIIMSEPLIDIQGPRTGRNSIWLVKWGESSTDHFGLHP